MGQRIAAFTDTYLPTVNGVTYSISDVRERWRELGERMDVVFPDSSAYDPEPGEHPVRSVPFPFYDGYRLGAPRIPESLPAVDVVHAHTPFAVGLAATRFARRTDAPLVATYHTPAGEYAPYLAPLEGLSSPIARLTTRYERRFYDRADLVCVPSEWGRRQLEDRLGVSTPTRVVPNGVDTTRFRPVDATAFRERYDLEGTLVGYTGRHSREKNLEELLYAAAGLEDATLVLSGDGPARPALEAASGTLDLEVRFLGMLERSELPAFYAALDAFGFPSPVETQGLVALEAIACGTPVVAARAGALVETVADGRTGYHYPPGDTRAFRRALQRALTERGRLEATCLARREEISLSAAATRLREVYAGLEGG